MIETNVNRLRGVMRGLMLVLVAVGVAACASTSAGGEGSTTLVVNNDLIPPSVLTIYAVPETGIRTRVGTVASSETVSLNFNPSGAGLQYRFLAETVGGNDIVSNPVTFSRGATIRWDLSANIATVTSD